MLRSAPGRRSRSGSRASSKARARPSTLTWTPRLIRPRPALGRARDLLGSREPSDPWLSPEVAHAVPRPSEEAIAAAKTLCRYIWNTYGRFPATIDPFLMTVWYQAAHLDVESMTGITRRKRFPPISGRTCTTGTTSSGVPSDGSFDLGDLQLERGGVIHGAQLAYRTHGVLARIAATRSSFRTCIRGHRRRLIRGSLRAGRLTPRARSSSVPGSSGTGSPPRRPQPMAHSVS